MHPKNLKLWLFTSFLALSVRFGAGLYYLYIGCPRILGDCYKAGASAAFWPITVSTLALYISALAISATLATRTLKFLVRLAKQKITANNSN